MEIIEETEKVCKYKIQEEISLFLADDTDSLKYFHNKIKLIDEIICLVKEKNIIQ